MKKDVLNEYIFKILGSRGARQMLEFLNQHDLVQYIQMKEFMTTHTLNTRLREFLMYGLIHYQFDRLDQKKGYKITEKGRQVLTHMHEIEKIINR